ncbi:hypothetical protein EDF56_106367 [Novosphingobium sp. PhB165]|uniref:hypothetical protein n=1 Tax=Novosphingobium sp. PhB165 TaxID=2485105 RepID=UPI001050B627|nr:hypothetical protein [Novosphingobium sp. PhB165]TCM17251.1 hypothetical protein EDF56_106367 [Novosphingobium sp. PhB165]
MTDKTPPVVEQEYLSGLKIIDIGDLRVARGMSRRPVSACKHRPMVYDRNERRIWCKDCETDVEPFDAFLLICEQIDHAVADIKRRQQQVDEAVAHNITRIAARQMDQHFRSRKYVPACPHCHQGIFPEDVPNMGTVGREWEEARRARKENAACPPTR